MIVLSWCATGQGIWCDVNIAMPHRESSNMKLRAHASYQTIKISMLMRQEENRNQNSQFWIIRLIVQVMSPNLQIWIDPASACTQSIIFISTVFYAQIKMSTSNNNNSASNEGVFFLPECGPKSPLRPTLARYRYRTVTQKVMGSTNVHVAQG